MHALQDEYATALVSVVVPLHNGELTLERCVRSVFADRHPALEVIIVDDGSTDGSAEILRRLKRQFGSRIRSAWQENAGANSARNAGLQMATGRYVQFLDCDDEIQGDKIAVSVAEFERDPELRCVYTDGVSVGRSFEPAPFEANHPDVHAVADRVSQVFNSRLNTNFPLWDREYLVSRKMQWDESLICWQDNEYYLRVLLELGGRSRIRHIPLQGVRHDRTASWRGITSHVRSERYVLGQRKALHLCMEACRKHGMYNKGVETQYEAYLGSLTLRAIVGNFKHAYRLLARDMREQGRSWNLRLASLVPLAMAPAAYHVYRQIKLLRSLVLHRI